MPIVTECIAKLNMRIEKFGFTNGIWGTMAGLLDQGSTLGLGIHPLQTMKQGETQANNPI